LAKTYKYRYSIFRRGKNSLDAVSLFSGIGGMDRGFIKAGHTIVWANDKNKDACLTYEKNLHIKPVCCDIRTVKEFPRADIVIGCNPCQGFSIIGPRNPDDPRNLLYREILRCIQQVRPKVFITENVKGLRSLYKGKFLDLIINDYTNAGYNVTWHLVNAKDYGVPQDRERIFCVGFRKDLNADFSFPEPTHGPKRLPYVSIEDTIGSLPAPDPKDYWTDNRFSFYYMSRNRRRKWHEVSFTIQASGRHAPLHPSSPPMKKIGKDEWVFVDDISKYRRLSVQECALIQTFDQTDQFIGSLQSQYLQIGNAVPPRLSQQIAEAINNTLKSLKVTATQCVLKAQ
jgi:DNA (cytosine-5)-methyltransferase 1